MASFQVIEGMHLQRTEVEAGPEEGPHKQHMLYVLAAAQVIEVDKYSPTSSLTRLLIRRSANPDFQFEQIEEHKEGGTVLVPSAWLDERYFCVIAEE